jgi:Flp pilus assembly protein TadG
LLNLKRSARQLGSADGAEIAEAALVLPLVFMLLLGIIWFGRAFNIYATIQQAAQQGAIVAARSSCATCGNQTSDSAVTAVVEAVMKSANLDMTQIISNAPASPVFCANPPYPAGGCSTKSDNVTVCRNVQLNPPATTQPVQCGTAVMFQYPFTFNFPGTSLNMQQIILSAQAQSRMEN